MFKVFTGLLSLLAASSSLAFHQRSMSSFVPRSRQGGLRQSSASSSALCMSTIAVIGASGLTASECVYQALQNGDNVVGLTRCVRTSFG